MIHTKQRWPEAMEFNLWPFAIKYVNDVANMAPSKSDPGASPLERFSQVPVRPQARGYHTFGSPVYVLDSKLQQGQRVGKWNNRSRIGMYLGMSSRHSRRAALVLNLRTGLVSPQYQCRYDDLFDTMRPSAGNLKPLSSWQMRAGFVESDDDHCNEALDVLNREPADTQARADTVPTTDYRQPDDAPLPSESIEDKTPIQQELNVPSQIPTHHDDGGAAQRRRQPRRLTAIPRAPNVANDAHEPPPQRITRSGRVVRLPKRFREEVAFSVPWDVLHNQDYDIQDEMQDPIAFHPQAMAASNNPDILYLREAQRAHDWKQFEQAMEKEVRSHEDMDHWELIKRDQLPPGASVLPAVWAFRRKRRIATQEIYKWKARLNLHGGKQIKDVNYWETYSPVVGWTTIRFFLILMLLNGWVSKQVDFVLAFPQADIECEMFMEVPEGFHVDGSRKDHCLRLKKNLYGQKQAGRVWNQYLHDGLIARGFKQSKVDMCVYYNNNAMI